jgi:hypothetical protein
MTRTTHIEDRDAWERGRDAAIRRNAAKTRGRKWIAEDDSRVELANFVANGGDGSDFSLDMRDALDQWGSLTASQEAAMRKVMARFEQREAERTAEWEAAADCPAGRVEVSGVIISTDLRDNAFGSQWKMLVRDDSGFKVWGSIPNKLMEQTETFINHQFFSVEKDLKGKRVSFTAAVEPSKDDQKFGFFKRPTKAKLEG